MGKISIIAFGALLFVGAASPALAVACDGPCASPGPIPGAGLLSYIALGAIGLGCAGWKKLRKPK
jgi:hypothetical protein